MSSSGFFSVSVDCHRWKSRGETVLKLDGWGGLLDSSTLVLEDGVDNDLENVEDVNVRLCLRRARRIMIQYQDRGGVNGEGRMYSSSCLQNFQ